VRASSTERLIVTSPGAEQARAIIGIGE
jgi:hypothetical protein